MKRNFIILTLSVFFGITTQAQENGFYRLQNVSSGRYLSIEDTNPNNYEVNEAAGSVDLSGIRTKEDWDYVSASPATIVYLNNVGGSNYDIQAQGTGIYKLTGNRIYITIKAQSDGSYYLTGTYKGFGGALVDEPTKGIDDSECYVYLGSEGDKGSKWNLKPINNENNYIGIDANVKTNDGYWGSIYAGFPFTLESDGMKAYYVDATGNGYFSLKEITGTIPAETPVIIKCTSNKISKNLIKPITTDGEKISGNQLYGRYCAIDETFHENYEVYNASKMRILGTSDDGKLAFVKAQQEDLFGGFALYGNRAYLIVPAGSPSTFTEGNTGIATIKADDTQKKEGIYTLTGIQIPDGVTPQPGVYIKNGKKVVIK